MKKKIVTFCLVAGIVSAQVIDDQDSQRLDQFLKGAYSTMETLHNTFELSMSCINNNVDGDFVECGVAAGSQVAAMGYACLKTGVQKKIHLFDSFQGIPLAGPNDDSQPGIVGPITHNVNVQDLNDLLVSSGIVVYSLEQVKSNMKKWGIPEHLLRYYEGWFQHVLPQRSHEIESICLLRLDGDLYESTKVCLEYLYQKISTGGYIIIDDYALTGCRKAVHEYLEKHNLNPKIIQISGGLGPVYWKID